MTTPSAIDDERLAEAYNRAVALEKAGDLDAAATAYSEVLALDPDDHGGASVRLAGIGRGDIPARAPAAYVATLFDQHAEVFDTVLVEDLGYCVPLLVRQRLQALALGPFEHMLDLGCGTGLAGSALADMVERATGADLSQGMIEMADEREVYTALYVADAVTFVEAEAPARFDLVVATDVLPYLGDLERLFAGVARCLQPDGLFAFSSETLPPDTLAGRPFMVGAHQRFAHASAYLHVTLESAGLSCLDIGDITVRSEGGEPIAGHLVLARRVAD